MDNLPFGIAEYRQFETTFLASVIVGMNFPSVQDASSRKKQWEDFTWALFSVKPMEGIFEKPIVINRSDNKLSFVFEKGRVQVHISGDGYQNFADSVIPHAYKLKQFVTEVAGVKSPTQLGIRKIDVFQIETDRTKKVDEDAIRSHFFSSAYCSLNEGAAALDEDEKRINGIKKNQWTEEDNQLTLRSAFVKVPNTENRYRLILDIDEQHSPVNGVKLDKLDETLKEMNMDLFNAFMWCVSRDVKNIMRQGKE